MRRLSVLFLVMLLSACSGLQVAHDNPVTRIAVQAGTLKYIEAAPDAVTSHERATRVFQVVRRLQQLVDSGTVATPAQLYEVLDDVIDWSKLDLAETLLVNELVGVVKFEIEKRIQDQVVDSDASIIIKEMLSWMETAAAIAELKYR